MDHNDPSQSSLFSTTLPSEPEPSTVWSFGSTAPPPSKALDQSAAAARRDIALALLDDYNADEWKQAAFELLREYARSHHEVHADPVLALVQARLPEPTSWRVMGLVYRRAKAEGVIAYFEPQRFRPSNSSNGLPKPVWRSCIYDPSRSLAAAG